ncbi:hypothetical protein D3C77_424150 [compost metagenome]
MIFKPVLEPFFLQLNISFDMVQFILQCNTLVLIMHAVMHHFGECGQQSVNSLRSQLQSKGAYNLQRVVEEMRIDLRLHGPQLVRFVR